MGTFIVTAVTFFAPVLGASDCSALRFVARSEFPREVDLARDFHETSRRIDMVTQDILGHRFNHRVFQAFAAQIIERPFNELPSQSPTAEFSGDRQVGYPAFARLTIDTRRDVAGDAAPDVRDEDAGR